MTQNHLRCGVVSLGMLLAVATAPQAFAVATPLSSGPSQRLAHHTSQPNHIYVAGVGSSAFYTPDGEGKTGAAGSLSVTDATATLAVAPVPAEIAAVLTFAGEAVPSHDQSFRVRYAREMAQAYRNNNGAQKLYARSQHWLPKFRKVFAQYGIPEDFVYLAVVESGLTNARAGSGAAGFWQLMPHTARAYGLKVRGKRDERMDPMKSAHAVARYLKACHREFHSWTMVAAAYNMGTGKLGGASRRQNSSDYYNLRLNGQTEQFVPRLVAYKQIFEQPEAFGLVDGNYAPRNFAGDVESGKSAKGRKVAKKGKAATQVVAKSKKRDRFRLRNLSISSRSLQLELDSIEQSLGVSHSVLTLLNPWLETNAFTDSNTMMQLTVLVIPADATLEMAENYARFTLGLSPAPATPVRAEALSERRHSTSQYTLIATIPRQNTDADSTRGAEKRSRKASAWAKLLCQAMYDMRLSRDLCWTMPPPPASVA